VRIQNLTNVTLLPLQPLERLAESLSLGDVHVVTLRDGFEGLIVPSKAYGAQATGRPLIYVGHPSGEIGRMINESGTGTVVSIGDIIKLAQSILRYYQDPSLKKQHGQKALKLHKTRYHHRNALMNYTRLLMGQKL
jgi:glycosyltransferase involved in cell wall biosynthesis